MELTWEQWVAMKKELRRKLGQVGWILLVYYLIMNVAVIVTAVAETSRIMGTILQNGGSIDEMMNVAMESGTEALGYFVAAGVGYLILMLWKTPRFWKEEIWAKGKPMTSASFFEILVIFLSGQMVFQVLTIVLELVLNGFGYTMMEGMEAVSVDTDSLGMFLYAGILGPITEEILFRGLIQRTLMPFGRRFAIFCSAFAFGIFHGNLIQTGYAFAVGLVLGYVASEYSIGWAMVLHMINNLVISDILTRLTAGLPDILSNLIIGGVLLACFAAAIVVAIVKRREIADYFRHGPMDKTYLGCFFSSAGVIVLMVVMGLSMVMSLFAMVTPL